MDNHLIDPNSILSPSHWVLSGDMYSQGMGARAYLPPLASNTLLVPSRLAFLQRSASGTVQPAA